MRNRHAWTERDESGEKCEIVATKERGRWSLRYKTSGAEYWTSVNPIGRDRLETLRDILFRKYQRRRASYEDVQIADRMLADLKNSAE